MKIFITGASGFVGGAAASNLAAAGHSVLAMSRSESSDEVIAGLGAVPVRCSLGSVPSSALEGVDAIIHAAAFVEEWGPYDAFFQANVKGTAQLLDAAVKAGVGKFIHIGTEAALFKGSDLINIDETFPYPETKFYYSRTKQEAERLVLASDNPEGLRTISLRPRMIWGPGDKTILPIILDKVKTGKFAWIDGGHYQTSSTNIANLVYAIELALGSQLGGEAFFITDGETRAFRDFITSLVSTQGVEIKSSSIPKWLARSLAAVAEVLWKTLPLPGAPPITSFAACMLSSHCTLNDAKARRLLSYQQKVTIEDGMEELRRLGKVV